LTQSNPPTGGQTTSDSYHILNYQNEPYSIESIIHFSKSTKTKPHPWPVVMSYEHPYYSKIPSKNQRLNSSRMNLLILAAQR